jgi:hypothetical protein
MVYHVPGVRTVRGSTNQARQQNNSALLCLNINTARTFFVI